MRVFTRGFSAICLAALSLSSQSALAGFTYDLRFSDTGLKSRELTSSGGTFTLIAYAIVTGNGTGIQAASFGQLAMFSQQINSGVVSGGGLVDADPIEGPLLQRTAARKGSSTSQAIAEGVLNARAPYSEDGIEDWGHYAPIGRVTNTAEQRAILRYGGDDPSDQFTGPFFGALIAGATTGTAEVPVAKFVVNFSSTHVVANSPPNAATRFRLEIPYRTNSAHGIQLAWYENVDPTRTTIPLATQFTDVGVATNATNFSTVRAAWGQQFVQNAYVDFLASAPVPQNHFIDLVQDGSGSGFPDVGDALVGVVVDIADAANGYVDIVPGSSVLAPPTTYVALDLVGGALPSNFNIVGGTNITLTPTGVDILSFYGSGLDVVFEFDELGIDLKFDLGSVQVDKILVFSDLSAIPEPTSLAAVALGGLVALRRRRA